jgi:hypothetical protein
MKESSCHDPKMDAYCQEVHKLEDKFDNLELSHIPRRLNKAADKLAKMASGQDPVLAGIFASDQHKPSVHFEKPGKADDEPPALGSGAGDTDKSITSGPGTNLPAALPDPKVMEIDEATEVELDPPAN